MIRERMVLNDGGRAAAGFNDTRGDCAIRAIAIATGKPYREVFNGLNATGCLLGQASRPSTHGVSPGVARLYLGSLGWLWVEQQRRMRRLDLPAGHLVVHVREHLVAVVDHVVYDDRDFWRGSRFVFGIFAAR
jgi:hypothetical protein